MRQDGSSSIAVVGLTGVLIVLAFGLADLGVFLLARGKAQTAADAAALAAAADQIPVIGRDPEGQARRFAAANGGRLVACDCSRGERAASVRVAVPVRFVLLGALGVSEVGARARAEVDLTRLGGGGKP